MLPKLLALFIFPLLCSSLSGKEAGEKAIINECIRSEISGNMGNTLAFEAIGDGLEMRIRSEDEITSILFSVLDELLKRQDIPLSLRKAKIKQFSEFIIRGVDTSKLRKPKPVDTNLDDKYVRILFEALRSGPLYFDEAYNMALSRFIEKITEINCGYSSRLNNLSENDRNALLNLWEKQYFEMKRISPSLPEVPKEAVSYEMFLKACKDFEIIYYGEMCWDGGSIPITLSNGVRIYTVYLKQSLIKGKKHTPSTIEITSNSSNYYASVPLKFPSENALLLSYGYDENRLFDALKGKAVNQKCLDMMKHTHKYSKDPNVKKQLGRLISSLEK